MRAALGELPAVDAARRDAAIAAALAAFDEDGTQETVASPAPVTPLAPRRRLSPTTVRVLSAAAVVAVLALLVPLLGSIDSGDDDATSFEATGNAFGGAGDDATSEDAETSGGSTTTAPSRQPPTRTSAPTTTSMPSPMRWPPAGSIPGQFDSPGRAGRRLRPPLPVAADGHPSRNRGRRRASR